MAEVLSGLWAELQKMQRDHHRPNLHAIRVTRLAIPGTAVVLPMSPERARLIDPRCDDYHLLPEPMTAEWWPREMLLHHEDWVAILTSLEATTTGALTPYRSTPSALWGIPVVVE